MRKTYCIRLDDQERAQIESEIGRNKDGSLKGSLATTIRMQPGYYLFPKGFVPA